MSARMDDQRPPGGIWIASNWMTVFLILLCWLPFFGPFLAGLLGGRKAGGVGNALVAALLPAVLIGAAALLLGTFLTGLPVVGVVAGFGSAVLVLSCSGALILGAVVGALL